MRETSFSDSSTGVPTWVPTAARVYLAHTEQGKSIRSLARGAGCHASTVLRQVRRIETRRDDPLIDAALRNLGAPLSPEGATHRLKKGARPMSKEDTSLTTADETTLTREGRRVLRRMCESGAVLAVAAEMDKAVVVRDTGEGGSTRTAVVDSTIAQAMALKDWIACETPGRISRYRITALGRSALSHMVAEHENRLRGFAESQASFESAQEVEAALERSDRDPAQRRGRYLLADSPLLSLSRRRDKDGTPFLSEDLVSAGERLREDFELAQIDPKADQNWAEFLAAPATEQPSDTTGTAKARFETALRTLGPGLGDVALRCCCYLEGLETTERQLGWSARSGKIVLRIALQRLKRHYEELALQGGDLIG